MESEIIIAVYDTAKDADGAVHALKKAGVAPEAITLHAKNDAVLGAEPDVVTPGVVPPPEQHFFRRMFGHEPTVQDERTTLVYEHSLDDGASVVVVHGVLPPDVRVVQILEKHNPVDLHERGETYGLKRNAEVGTYVRRHKVKRPAP